MFNEKVLSRRTVLKGLGVTLALPWLEKMGMQTSWAAGNTPVAQAAPNRMAYVYIPNGVITEGWRIPTEGALPAKLPPILKPLTDLSKDFSILSGLTADKARAHGDGGGDDFRGHQHCLQQGIAGGGGGCGFFPDHFFAHPGYRGRSRGARWAAALLE
mgnify:CR=1 FL=1